MPTSDNDSSGNRIVTLTLNGRFLTQRITGVQRYALEMLLAIDALLAKGKSSTPLEAELLVPPDAPDHLPTLQAIAIRRVGRLRGHAWEQIDLPRFARGLILNFCNTFPISLGRQVVVIHDASIYSCPEGYTAKFRAYYRSLFTIAAHRPDIKIATVSHFSANEIERFARIPKARISVIPDAVDHCYSMQPDESVLDRFKLRNKHFLMALGSENKNKNIASLVEAYSQLSPPDVPLVLAGGKNSQVFSGVHLRKNDQLIRTGYLTDGELAALYSNALAFVFPSLYEGFGLPPLEAMYFGCPVICSRAASVPEVAGDAALYCNALDVDDISTRLREVIENEALRLSLTEKGVQQAAKFTWQSSAEKMLDLALTARPDAVSGPR